MVSVARPQNFNETEVIDAAMRLFWSRGYVAAGMSRLLGAIQLKPGSFYNTSLSKQALFVRALERYSQQIVADRTVNHLDTKDPMNAIENFFLSSFEQIPKSKLIGCLLTNTATEMGTLDAEINRVVRAGLQQIESAFKRRITEAQEEGLIDPRLELEAAALHLFAPFGAYRRA